jgi:hypothetical protein
LLCAAFASVFTKTDDKMTLRPLLSEKSSGSSIQHSPKISCRRGLSPQKKRRKTRTPWRPENLGERSEKLLGSDYFPQLSNESVA